jgi:hypothetical protein
MSLVQLVANHTVRVTITPGRAAIPATKDTPGVPAQKPVFTDVQKGSMFLIDADSAAELVKLGAASYYRPAPQNEVVVAATSSVPADVSVEEGSRRRGPRRARNPATESVLEGDEGDDQV